jgi:hypothetical protein
MKRSVRLIVALSALIALPSMSAAQSTQDAQQAIADCRQLAMHINRTPASFRELHQNSSDEAGRLLVTLFFDAQSPTGAVQRFVFRCQFEILTRNDLGRSGNPSELVLFLTEAALGFRPVAAREIRDIADLVLPSARDAPEFRLRYSATYEREVENLARVRLEAIEQRRRAEAASAEQRQRAFAQRQREETEQRELANRAGMSERLATIKNDFPDPEHICSHLIQIFSNGSIRINQNDLRPTSVDPEMSRFSISNSINPFRICAFDKTAQGWTIVSVLSPPVFVSDTLPTRLAQHNINSVLVSDIRRHMERGRSSANPARR